MPTPIPALALACALALTVGSAAADPYDEALAAYDAANASEDQAERQAGFARALELLSPLVEAKHPGAMYHAGQLQLWGLGGLESDPIAGTGMIKEAAESGYPTAQAFLGFLASEGDGTAVRRTQEDALMWYLRAAIAGQCGAVRRISVAYEKGELGLAVDADRAELWKERLEDCTAR